MQMNARRLLQICTGRILPRAIRPVLSTVRFRLRAHWKSLLFTALVGGTSLALLFAAQSFITGGEVLRLIPIPPTGGVLAWTSQMREAATLRSQALHDLLLLLVGVGYVTLSITIVTLSARSAAAGAARRAEQSVRRAVGASRRTLLGSLVLETVLYLVSVLAIGLALGLIATRLGADLWPGPIGDLRFAPGGVVLLLIGAAPVLIVLLVGATARVRLVEPEQLPVTLTIPAAQLGVSLAVLIGGAMVMDRSSDLTTRGPGVVSSGIVIPLRLAEASPPVRSERYRALLEGYAGNDSSATVSLTSPGVLMGLGLVDQVTTNCGMCPSSGIILQFQSFPAAHAFVSADTFKAQRTVVIQGRGISDLDGWDAPRVAVVNRRLALRYFQQGDAIGRDIFIASGFPATPYQVVGIVDDEPSQVLGAALEPRPTVYLSILQHPPANAELLVEAIGPTTLLDGIAAGKTVDRAALVRREAGVLRWFAAWFRIGGVVMLTVAILGTFTSLRMWVRSRAAEIAVRRSLGATRFSIAGSVAWEAAMMGLSGVAIGLFLFATIVRPPLAEVFAGLPPWSSTAVVGLSILLLATTMVGALTAVSAILRGSPAAAILHPE